MSKKLILFLIIILAVLTRVLFLDSLPNGFTGDEAQQGYSAYSILKTGRDEWGQVLPLNPRGFGDFKPPLYTYVTIPSIAIFGLNPFAVRFPAALCGILLVIVTYFLTKELTKNEEIGIWAAGLLAISPWAIQLSRTAFEGEPGVLLFASGLLFFLKALENKKYLILSVIFWGLTLYTYHASRVFTGIFILGLIVLFRNHLLKSKNIFLAILFLIFLLPLVLNIQSILVRSSDVGITSQAALSGYFANRGVESIPIISKLFDNKFIFIKTEFIENYLSYFSPTFFFTGARSDGTYLNFPYFGLLFLIEILFWIFAIFEIYKDKNSSSKKIIILWFLLAAIPASLASGSFNANRAPTFLPLVSIISAIGVVSLISWIKSKTNFNKRNISLIMMVLLLLSFSNFLYFYIIKLPQRPPENLRFGYDQVFTATTQLQNQYDEVIFSKVFTEPQIFVAFYGNIDPITFQNNSTDWLRYEKSNKLYVDQLESWNLGKFYFQDLDWKNREGKMKNALIVSKPEDFPIDVKSVLDIKNPQGKVIYRLVSTRDNPTQ